MREFKFRAWHRERKCWVNTLHIYEDGSWCAGIQEERGLVEGYDERECDLMQYTGLHDRLGKKVFEGDIIKYFQADACQIPAEVYWDKSQSGFRLATGGDRQFGKTRLLLFAKIGEVIGNVHENPELLEDKSTQA